MDAESQVGRITRTWALDAAAFAETLVEIDPSWGSEVTAVAGGLLVLCGPGMYVNRLMGAGLEAPLSEQDWNVVEARSAAVGVPAAIEITEATRPEVLEAAR